VLLVISLDIIRKYTNKFNVVRESKTVAVVFMPAFSPSLNTDHFAKNPLRGGIPAKLAITRISIPLVEGVEASCLMVFKLFCLIMNIIKITEVQ